jgi:hypothetical protein
MIQKPPKRALCLQLTPPQSPIAANQETTPLLLETDICKT